MYWPLNVARRLLPPRLPATTAEEDDDADIHEPALHLAPAPPTSHPSHFVLLTASSIHLYSTRPAQCVASLKRTQKSLVDYGSNKKAWWRPGLSGERGAEIAVETTTSHVLIFTITVSDPLQAYSYSAAGPSSSKKGLAPSVKSLKNTFAAAAGEATGSWAAGNGELRIGDGQESQDRDRGVPLVAGGGAALEIRLKLAFKVDAGVSCALPTSSHLIVATVSPAAIQAIPWPDPGSTAQTETTLLAAFPWFHAPVGQPREGEDNKDHDTPPVYISQMTYSSPMEMFVWIASDGRAYVVTLDEEEEETRLGLWRGRCFHGVPSKLRRRSSARHRTAASENGADPNDSIEHNERSVPALPSGSVATSAAINAQMGLIAVGQADGINSVYILRSQHRAVLSHRLSLREALRSTASHLTCGAVQCQQWTADGLALAVGWQTGWSVWSAWGKLMGHSYVEDFATSKSKNYSDTFMSGAQELFWGPSGTELFIMANERSSSGKEQRPDRQLFSVPHAKSALAGQHSPDNTRFAFIQLDDSLLVYRGSDQPDMSIINPESDVWHHIKIPQEYLASNWPIRYACISNDGLLIAISGRRGLAHYSASSGRWKLFKVRTEEENFTVRGGMQWYQHVLVVACQSGDETQLRLYSRDSDLSDSKMLYTETLPSSVILTSLFEDSLLVYTSDNTFYHYLIVITQDTITLQLCGSITFEGVVGEPERVRGMSWMIPKSQQRFGEPMEDLTVATIIFLVDGKLVLLRPRKAGQDTEEVAYDMQILGDRIEYYWTHLHGIGTLENSLWGYDGSGIKLWLDALTIEQAEPRVATPQERGEDGEEDEDSAAEADVDQDEMPEYKTIEESLSMPLQFYPLCVVLEKGIVIGVEPEISLRKNLDFTVFRSGTTTHLFLHQLLRYYLEQGRTREAVICASSYRSLVYFSHALEVLLHAVLEDEADALMSASGGDDDDERLGLTTSSSSTSIVVHDTDASFDASTDATRPNAGEDSLDRNGFASSERRVDIDRIGNGQKLLPVVVDFLDHFEESLSVVVNCARKTEFVRWEYLFSIVGPPQDLFAKCLAAGDLKTAASYLLVLQNLEPFDHSIRDTAHLLRLAVEDEDWPLCQDLLRYTRSLDEEGTALKEVVAQAGILDEPQDVKEQTTVEANGALQPPQWSRSTSSSSRRSISSSSTVLETPQEADEEEDENTHTMSIPTGQVSDGSPVPRRGGPIRSFSSSRVTSNTTLPPIPQVSVNGRIMPSPLSGSGGNNSPLFPRRSSSSSLEGGGTTGAGTGGTLGMSLHRVGLRSAEQVFLSPGASRSFGARRASGSDVHREPMGEKQEGGGKQQQQEGDGPDE